MGVVAGTLEFRNGFRVIAAVEEGLAQLKTGLRVRGVVFHTLAAQSHLLLRSFLAKPGKLFLKFLIIRLRGSAAADFLGTREFVERSGIGAIGICGSGSFAVSAAKIDPRLKAVATVSMYDMGAASRSGLKNAQTLEQRKRILAEAAEQRYAEFTGGETAYTGGTADELTENSTPVEREFYAFYRTPRGEFTPEGATHRTTTHPTLASNVKFMNFYPFNDIETISPRPLLFIVGENAHSREFSEDAFRRAAEPKELYVVPGAGHVDLYDRTGLIPFDKLEEFFGNSLK